MIVYGNPLTSALSCFEAPNKRSLERNAFIIKTDALLRIFFAQLAAKGGGCYDRHPHMGCYSGPFSP